jgi:ureidoglycolate dehydrogenase (NAD+)
LIGLPCPNNPEEDSTMTQPVHPGAVRLPADTLTRWASACLRAVGMPDADADELAAALAQTSLWGIDSHGIARLTHYLDRIRRGSIKAAPAMEVQRTGPCTALLHGDMGQGHVVAFRANRLAMTLAREAGIGAVGVTDSSHCGAIGLYARVAARAGLVGIAFTHADSVAVPFGGQRPYFGTNPIAIAFPRAGGEPVCLDMATTSIPMNRVKNARREGHPLPPDVAVDAQGRVTTDAQAAIAVTPLGGEHYGHKGYALAMMVDLLCGPLLGNPWGPHLSRMYADLDTPRRLGAFFIVIDPARFGGPLLPAVVAQMAAELAAEPGSPRIPGDPELAEERERQAQGIPIEPELLVEMRQWSDELGVAVPK